MPLAAGGGRVILMASIGRRWAGRNPLAETISAGLGGLAIVVARGAGRAAPAICGGGQNEPEFPGAGIDAEDFPNQVIAPAKGRAPEDDYCMSGDVQSNRVSAAVAARRWRIGRLFGAGSGERRRVLLLALLAFALMAVANLTALYMIERGRRDEERSAARYAALDAAADIQMEITQSLSTLHLLRALVHESGGSAPNFERVASQMLPSFPAVSALQLAPGGVVQRIVPVQGNERAIGHDLLNDPSRDDEALRAVQTRRMTLAGPFTLIQGGTGMVARMPIFLNRPDGGNPFWGFATALIRTDDLMRAAGIEQLPQLGYDYRLTRWAPGLAEEQVIATSVGTRIAAGEVQQVIVPNGEWLLTVGRRGGWGSPWLIVFEAGVSVFVAALVGGLTYMLLNQPLILRREVQLRTSELEFQASHDDLTGLANRGLLCDRTEQAIRHARRSGSSVALLLVDLDRFKTINDSLGHSIGDDLLVSVSRRLASMLRESDTLSRLGGDEFVIMMPDVRFEADVVAVCEKLVRSLSQPVRMRGVVAYPGGSIGVAVFPRDGDSAETLLRNADAAMYRAKEHGRGRYHFYESSLNARVKRRMALEAGLREAIGRGELKVQYQPKLATRSGRIVGAEALLRWNSPQLGEVSPAEFVPLAEETGLIGGIGEWALAEACRQLRVWHDDGHREMKVAVNISAIQFRQRQLAQRVEHIVRATGVPASALELELTESMVMENAEEAASLLDALRALGVSLSLDDFGTGQSSLWYLERFPIDALKIDKSFIARAPDEGDAAAISRAVVALARNLNLRVVAEGVETPAHWNFVCELGCDEAQGFLFSRAIDGDALGGLLVDQAWAQPNGGLLTD